VSCRAILDRPERLGIGPSRIRQAMFAVNKKLPYPINASILGAGVLIESVFGF